MQKKTEQFINIIIEKNPLQEKYLKTHLEFLTEKELKDLESILLYFESSGFNLLKQAEAYLELLEMIAWETKFFIENGKYRYSLLEEVINKVYNKHDYMERYMVALGISDYLWSNHLEITRWFQREISKEKGESYLEIGPGHGQYFYTAMQNSNFKTYVGVDISPTSVAATRNFILYSEKNSEKNIEKNWTVKCRNFFDFKTSEKFQCIAMMEVLEHVENPKALLEKIYDHLLIGGATYITTVVNAPAIDHIYLFRSIEEIRNLFTDIGFIEEDCFCVCQNNYSLEKAIRKKAGINVAFKLLKKQN